MKKYLLVLATGLILSSCGDDSKPEAEDSSSCSNFARIKNTGKTVILGEEHSISLNLEPDCLKKIEIKIDGKAVAQFEGDIQKEVNYKWVTASEKLGTHRVEVLAELENGQTRKMSTEKLIIASAPPVNKRINIINSFPHDPSAYTQGLEFDGDRLIESTGQKGSSWLREVNIEDGTLVGEQTVLDSKYFGEGITILGDKIYQVTYQSGEGFIYDKNTLEQIDRFTFTTNTGEGWGLTNDGEQLLLTDGSHRIYFVDPENFIIKRNIEVYTNTRPISYLNELEYIDGKIYANIYQDNHVAVINPKNGMVEEVLDLSPLESALPGPLPEVLNGLAYNKNADKLYATGKLWPLMFEIEIVD